MTVVAAWILMGLGLGHMAMGFVLFRQPLAEALRAGFIGKFAGTQPRRTAFWFLMFGPLLVMGGHVTLHAATTGDAALLRIVGTYLLIIGAAGSLVSPKSRSGWHLGSRR